MNVTKVNEAMKKFGFDTIEEVSHVLDAFSIFNLEYPVKDIMTPETSRVLEEIHLTHPELLRIFKRNYSHETSKKIPYFSALLTENGVNFIRLYQN